jgi:pimeloyl-ACP methyl ester carboxylesterase
MTVTIDKESTSKFAQAGPYRVHYHEAGQGPAVIMLHGGGPGASGYSNFSGNFGAFAGKHRTLLVDMLNFGDSDSVVFDREPATTVRARALRDLMDAVGIERASFVGNSLGGSTAMAFAHDYPDRTDKLVLMGAGGLWRTVIAPQPTEGHKRLQEAFAHPTTASMQALVNVMLFDPKVVTPELLEARVAAAQHPGHRDAAARSTMGHRDQRDELARIKAKTLIIWGREDRVNPMEIGLQLLRDIPDSRLLVFKNCGHWAQVEHVREFNEVSLAFLDAP